MSSVHSGRHGPKPPKRIDASIFHRHPSASSRAPTDTRWRSQSIDSRGFIRARRLASSSNVPGLRCVYAVRRRWASQSRSSLVSIFVRSCSATSEPRRRAGMPSMLITWVKRYGWASASWIINEPPLLWPSTGAGRPAEISSITAIASRRSASQPYSAACSLSPWPRWSHTITRQPWAAIRGANSS